MKQHWCSLSYQCCFLYIIYYICQNALLYKNCDFHHLDYMRLFSRKNVVSRIFLLHFGVSMLISLYCGVAYGQSPTLQDSVAYGNVGLVDVMTSESVASLDGRSKIYGLLKHYNDSVNLKSCNKTDGSNYVVEYDRFKEQFKEPWIGDLLKAIIFR